MQAVTGCDGSWPFFHFWHHNLWPKLASPILDFCGRKRPFQWYPDKSDRPNGVWDKHKNAKKVEWKTQSKLSCHYTWLLRGTNCLSPRFLRGFLTVSKPSRRSITAAKRKGEKGKAKKKKFKNQKPKDVQVTFSSKNSISKFGFLHMPELQCRKTQRYWKERQAVML